MQLNLFTTKKCTKCGEIKLLCQFSKGSGKDKYRYKCRKCRSEYTKQYTQKHKQERSEYHAQYQLNHKEKLREYRKQYRQKHKDNLSIQRKQYYQEHKEEAKIWKNLYWQSEKGKMVIKKSNIKRGRRLGFNPLNKPFENSVWHHINDNDVIAIPELIHKACFTGETKRHRDLVLAHYGSLENMLINK